MCQNGYCKLMYIRKICKTFLSNTISPYLKPVSKGTYLFSGSNHVHPCALNKGVQVVSVAEYICQVSQGQYKLFFFKMLFYATTWLSEKFLDSFVQFENTSEHSVTGQLPYFGVIKKYVVFSRNFVTKNLKRTVI